MTEWNRLDYAEARYKEEEPWDYSQRGVERLRHYRVIELAKATGARRILDVGCSLGQLTRGLAELKATLTAVDLSPTAVKRARENVPSAGFVAARSMELPFRDGAFDLVVASDGLYSWDIERNERERALAEIERVLAANGHAVFTEHTRPSRFPEFQQEIEQSQLIVERVFHMYDRPAYQFESWFKSVRGWPIVRTILKSLTVARGLTSIGRMFGSAGARHIVVLTRKKS